MSKDWINNLKVGDTVIIVSGWSNRKLGIVDAINKATISVNHTLYNKSTGRQRGGDTYSYACIKESTAEEVEKIKLDNDKYSLSKKLQSFDCSHLTKEQVDKFNNFLKTEFNK